MSEYRNLRQQKVMEIFHDLLEVSKERNDFRMVNTFIFSLEREARHSGSSITTMEMRSILETHKINNK